MTTKLKPSAPPCSQNVESKRQVHRQGDECFRFEHTNVNTEVGRHVFSIPFWHPFVEPSRPPFSPYLVSSPSRPKP